MREPARQSMKDGLGDAAVGRLAAAVGAALPALDATALRRDLRRGLAAMELRQRVDHCAAVLDAHLPRATARAVAAAVRAGAAFPPARPGDPHGGFAAWPLIDWVALRCAGDAAHFDRGMRALARLTGLFSAEFAVRAFLLADGERALAHVRAWTADRDPAVRRLASEGSRPRLPWGRRLSAFVRDPSPTLPVLEALKDDADDSVRRSVANHLNDIAKDHPDLVVRLAGRWSRGAGPGRAWIVRHATRTLVKDGHAGAMAVLGFDAAPEVDVHLTLSPRRLALGGALQLSVHLRSRAARAQRLVVDYAVHHRKADGSLRPKVFKLRTLELAAGDSVQLSKRHPITAISTRRYWSGGHAVEVLVNGAARGRVEFRLRVEE